MLDKLHKPEFFEQPTNEPIAVAHRMNSQSALDNARKTFERYNLPPYAEIDVAHTRDGRLVVYHGSTNPWQRYIKKRGPSIRKLAGKTFSETRNFSIDGEPISTLEDILNNNPDFRFFIHLKTNVAAKLLTDMLNNNERFRQQVNVGSFKRQHMQEFTQRMDERKETNTAISFGDAAIESLLLVRENAKKTKTRKMANVALRLVNADHFTANEYWDRLSTNNWLAARYTTTNMLKVVREQLGVPVVTHFSLPSYVTRKGVDKKVNEGFDGIMGDNIELICAAIARKRNKS